MALAAAATGAINPAPGCGSARSEADGVWKLTQALWCDRVTCNQAQQPARLIMTVGNISNIIRRET